MEYYDNTPIHQENSSLSFIRKIIIITCIVIFIGIAAYIVYDFFYSKNGTDAVNDDLELSRTQNTVASTTDIKTDTPALDNLIVPSDSNALATTTTDSITQEQTTSTTISQPSSSNQAKTENNDSKSVQSSSTKNSNLSSAQTKQKSTVSSTKSTSNTKYIVQVASFISYDNALKLKNLLKKSGYTAFISIKKINTTFYYRVRIGGFSEKSKAEQIADELIKKIPSIKPMIFENT